MAWAFECMRTFTHSICFQRGQVNINVMDKTDRQIPTTMEESWAPIIGEQDKKLHSITTRQGWNAKKIAMHLQNSRADVPTIILSSSEYRHVLLEVFRSEVQAKTSR
ncbi:uncharacterized protein MEPE_05137 [Melanopsichium pennsylvanicum]|uniref:Uncharacterized protein n=1 Tax=Melanopsichium pennsylvanicum TaxID=63383 RepID=A0AAJ5C7C9_9BASI|nr:uncharacterized protein MEPE_05137 [Melanopsichium pennsylvanicum]